MAVIADLIGTYNVVEQEGVVVSMSRRFMVTGLTPTGIPTPDVQAFIASGIPQHGASAPGNSNLKVRQREYSMVQDTPSAGYVDVQYATVADYANSFIFSGGSSIQQKQTDVDRLGNRIQLSWTYPSDYPDEDVRGEVYTTAINESVTTPHLTMTATGSLYVDYPNEIALDWINKVNSTFWAGAPAYYWLCTACNFRGRDIGLGRSHLWEFDWTFEFNPSSWAVVAKITDPNTGNVPDDVVDGVGVKAVDWYLVKDFNTVFGNT
jgi:hypothetical protein